MTALQKVRIAIATGAVIVWGYGYATEDARLRLAGIVLLAIALALRFAPQRKWPDDAAT